MKITLEQLKEIINKPGIKTPSGAGNWMDLILREVDRGKTALSMKIRPEMCNPYGMIHGGMMSLLIDESIGWAIISLESDRNYTSLNLMVDFLYGAAMGEEILARAEVIRQGKKIINAEVRVYNKDQVLLAKATSNLIVTTLPKKFDYGTE